MMVSNLRVTQADDWLDMFAFEIAFTLYFITPNRVRQSRSQTSVVYLPMAELRSTILRKIHLSCLSQFGFPSSF